MSRKMGKKVIEIENILKKSWNFSTAYRESSTCIEVPIFPYNRPMPTRLVMQERMGGGQTG